MPDVPDYDLPTELLPPGFAETLDRPPAEPVAPRPAATVVLVRDRADGPEVLLLRRTRSSGFVPGAWVFPGGRVDAGDAVPDLLARLDGLDGAEAARRLGLEREATPGPAAVAYYLAALREAFEETGILVGHRAGEP
ncbi:MAG: NUDIX domain-containing protein, partial [Gemmatimonadetes bacterium]|nr:NUDIX domain-containing protein [Gemmatimonadota bacterium]